MKDPNIIQQLIEMLLELLEWIKNSEAWFTFSQWLGALFDAFCKSYPEFPEFVKIIKDVCATVSVNLRDICETMSANVRDICETVSANVRDICETISAYLLDIVYWFNYWFDQFLHSNLFGILLHFWYHFIEQIRELFSFIHLKYHDFCSWCYTVFHDLYLYCYTKISKWDDAITNYIADIRDAINIWYFIFLWKHQAEINAFFDDIDQFIEQIKFCFVISCAYIYFLFYRWAMQVPLDEFSISALIVKFAFFLKIISEIISSTGLVCRIIFGFYDSILLYNLQGWYQPIHDWLLNFSEQKDSWTFYSQDLPMSIKNGFNAVYSKISELHLRLVAENKRIYSEFFKAPIDFCKEIKTSFFNAGESCYSCLKDKAIQVYDFFILCHNCYLEKCTAQEVVQTTFGSQIHACDTFWINTHKVAMMYGKGLFDTGFRFSSQVSYEYFLTMYPLPSIMFFATLFWGSFFLVLFMYNSSRRTKGVVIAIMLFYLFCAFVICPIFF